MPVAPHLGCTSILPESQARVPTVFVPRAKPFAPPCRLSRAHPRSGACFGRIGMSSSCSFGRRSCADRWPRRSNPGPSVAGSSAPDQLWRSCSGNSPCLPPVLHCPCCWCMVSRRPFLLRWLRFAYVRCYSTCERGWCDRLLVPPLPACCCSARCSVSLLIVSRSAGSSSGRFPSSCSYCQLGIPPTPPKTRSSPKLSERVDASAGISCTSGRWRTLLPWSRRDWSLALFALHWT